MRILFIKSVINSHSYSFDIGIASLSAVLKKSGHTVNLFMVKNMADISLLNYRIKLFNPDIIAFSTYASSFRSTVTISSYVKKSFPNVHQVMGGIHLILNPNDIEKAPDVDAVCIGEGESAFPEYIKKFEKRDGSHLYTSGFWTRKKGKIIRNSGIPFISDINTLPCPNREVFRNQLMINSIFKNRFCLEFLFTRGCPFTCTYCSNHALRKTFGQRGYVRRMSVSKAINWIKHDVSAYSCEGIIIHDDTFTVDHVWVKEFLRLYQEIHLPFICNLRVGTFDQKLLRDLKRAGCIAVYIGIESGDEQLRSKTMNRHMTNTKIIQSFSWVKKLRLEAYAFLMMGLPDETKTSFLKTVTLIAEIAPTSWFLSIFYPYPGTDLYYYAKKRGFLKGKQPTDFVERTDTLLTMPLFQRRDILYFFHNFDALVHHHTHAANITSRLHHKIKYGLLTVSPSSKVFFFSQALLQLDDAMIHMLRLTKRYAAV